VINAFVRIRSSFQISGITPTNKLDIEAAFNEVIHLNSEAAQVNVTSISLLTGVNISFPQRLIYRVDILIQQIITLPLNKYNDYVVPDSIRKEVWERFNNITMNEILSGSFANRISNHTGTEVTIFSTSYYSDLRDAEVVIITTFVPTSLPSLTPKKLLNHQLSDGIIAGIVISVSCVCCVIFGILLYPLISATGGGSEFYIMEYELHYNEPYDAEYNTMIGASKFYIMESEAHFNEPFYAGDPLMEAVNASQV
jgi:hypothetical protein